MENQDTIYLLQECDSGTKMAISSIDEVLDYVDNQELKMLLSESKHHHEKLENEILQLHDKYHSEEKEPGTMAKSMSWLKTNFKIAMNESDSTIAELITDGCHMGLKSLHKYMNDYTDAEHDVIDVCNRLIDIEEELLEDLEGYL